MRHSASAAVFAAGPAAVAVVAPANAANNTKATEVVLKASQHPGKPVRASLTARFAIMPKTAKQTLWRVVPPLHQNGSR